MQFGDKCIKGLQLFRDTLFLKLGGRYMDAHYIVLSTLNMTPEGRSVPWLGRESSSPSPPSSQPTFSSAQSLRRVQLFETPWIAARQASLSITNSWSSLKLMSMKSVMPSSHLILCHPLLLLPPIPLSIRVFSNESTLRMRWPKYWSFSFSISPSNEHPVLISFRMDWLDLLAVQGTLKSLLQHHSSKASTLQCSAFFTVQLSHPYMTTGKTIALTRRTFVGKVMSLLFNMPIKMFWIWSMVTLLCWVNFYLLLFSSYPCLPFILSFPLKLLAENMTN